MKSNLFNLLSLVTAQAKPSNPNTARMRAALDLPMPAMSSSSALLARWAWRVTPGRAVATLRGRDGSALSTESEHRQEIKLEA